MGVKIELLLASHSYRTDQVSEVSALYCARYKMAISIPCLGLTLPKDCVERAILKVTRVRKTQTISNKCNLSRESIYLCANPLEVVKGFVLHVLPQYSEKV